MTPPKIGDGPSDRRRAPEGPHPGDGRPAPARRDVPEESLLAAGDQAPAVPGPLQHAPAPPHLAGALPGLDHRALCTPRGTATRPAAAGSSSASRRDRATKRRVPGASSPRSCAGPTGGRSPTRTSESRWSCTASARAEGDFDAGIEMALSAVLVNPQFLFRIETGPARRRAALGLPHPRHPARLPPVVLPLEQHPGRRAARPGRARRAEQARGARTTGPPHAGRPAVAEPGDQLRGPVAAPAQPGFDHPGPAPVPRLRRQPAAGLPPGDGAPVRGASCARTAACSTC